MLWFWVYAGLGVCWAIVYGFFRLVKIGIDFIFPLGF
jgi:hypothetical protein